MADILKKLDVEVQKLEAFNDCHNLMAKYTHYLARYQGDKIVALFAKEPDTKVESLWGVYNGIEGVARRYQFNNPLLGESLGVKGELHLRPLSSDLVEVADDLKTAKGAWHVRGVETGKDVKTGEVEAGWIAMTFGVDFIRTGDGWRIWHLHEYSRLQTTFDVDFGAQQPFDPFVYYGTTREKFFADRSPDKPDSPPTTGWGYHPYALYPADQPTAPKSYETFDPELSY